MPRGVLPRRAVLATGVPCGRSAAPCRVGAVGAVRPARRAAGHGAARRRRLIKYGCLLGNVLGRQLRRHGASSCTREAVAFVSAEVSDSWAWGRYPALSWVLPLKAARGTEENQVNQSQGRHVRCLRPGLIRRARSGAGRGHRPWPGLEHESGRPGSNRHDQLGRSVPRPSGVHGQWCRPPAGECLSDREYPPGTLAYGMCVARRSQFGLSLSPGWSRARDTTARHDGLEESCYVEANGECR